MEPRMFSPATVEEVPSQRLFRDQRLLENDSFHVLGIDPVQHRCRSFLSSQLNLHAHVAVEEVDSLVSLAAVLRPISLLQNAAEGHLPARTWLEGKERTSQGQGGLTGPKSLC